jgi:hypothetical protein
MSKANAIEVQVVVPAKVKEADREKFEAVMLDFLFGHDRIRPELSAALEKHGVCVNTLAKLSEPETLGVCPTPDTLEFVPGPNMMSLAKRNGLDLTAGGRVFVTFDYEARAAGASDNVLYVNLGLPSAFAKEGATIQKDTLGEVTRALFGDCQLSARAQDYLRAHGVDLVEFAADNKALLDGGQIPVTSRVRPETAKVLDELGINTDRLGQIEVGSIHDIRDSIGSLADDPWTKTVWSRTTCC